MHSESKLSKILILLCMAVLGGAGNAFSQDLPVNRENYELAGWKFYKGDILSAESGDRISEKGWQDVNIPHTWNAEDVLTEGDHCYQGVAWYRCSFDLPKGEKKQAIFYSLRRSVPDCGFVRQRHLRRQAQGRLFGLLL